MTTDTLFEVQALREGRWQTYAALDDESLAKDELHRLRSTSRQTGLRVVAERYDPATGTYRARTVESWSCVSSTNNAAIVAQGRAPRSTRRAPAAGRRQSHPAAPPQARGLSTSFLAWTAFKFSTIVTLGAAALYGFRLIGA